MLHMLGNRLSTQRGGEWKIAASLAMTALVVSNYPGDDHDFRYYMNSLDLTEMAQQDDYLALLEQDEHEVVQFLSSRTQCSCIHKDLTCNHGFTTPPSGDHATFSGGHMDVHLRQLGRNWEVGVDQMLC